MLSCGSQIIQALVVLCSVNTTEVRCDGMHIPIDTRIKQIKPLQGGCRCIELRAALVLAACKISSLGR